MPDNDNIEDQRDGRVEALEAALRRLAERDIWAERTRIAEEYGMEDEMT